MDKINYKGKSYKGPGSWQDCSQLVIIKLIPFSRLKAESLDDHYYELAAQIVFSIPVKDWAKWLLTAQEWQMLKDRIQWVFTPPALRPFPSFKHLGITYILPLENFADTTALELSMAFMAYTDFADPENPDVTALDRLIGTICRPKRKDLNKFRRSDQWTGDEREPFNEARTMIRSGELATLPLAVKVVVLSYFESQSKVFLDTYEMLFGADGVPRYGDGRGWIMLLKNIAKEGHFGNFDEVGRQYAHLVYAAALDDTITAEETREQTESEHGS